ncbi:hypothetical protein FIBSPDRAFT_764783, partial [Athelia psychrophila]
TIKLIIVGDSGCGKTSLRGQNYFIVGRFSTSYRATIGADFIPQTLPHTFDPENRTGVRAPNMGTLSSAFFRGGDTVKSILIYDVSSPNLQSLRRGWNEFRERAPVRGGEGRRMTFDAWLWEIRSML